ncbi:coiled-coil domain-containing protein 157-like [Symsagittifera roscoffensis]|uniref:coiled-coil domain-containing protein 157-like n=1 Tax=Symsagittifera roscoffensis TaxID=84072 RepID=UPI00307B10EA
MAHLLGSKACIQSLRQDVLDLHTTISESVVQSGMQVNVKSWKYPDQLASDVNILELLSEHDYDANEAEDNQVSHIVMYELVIDRLVYLLHLATTFVSQSLETTVASFGGDVNRELSRVGSAVSNGPTRAQSMSTGLMVKKLWNKLSAFNRVFLETQEKNITLAGNADALEEALEKVTLDFLELTRNANVSKQQHDVQNGTSGGLSEVDGTASEASLVPTLELYEKYLAKSDRHSTSVSCQTLQTSFLSCNNCSFLQRSLFGLCDSLNLVCQNYGLKSTGNKFLATKNCEVVQTGNLSVTEVERLSNELNKDLNAILKKCCDQNVKLENFSMETCDLKKKVEDLVDKLNNFDVQLNSEREKSQIEMSKLNAEFSDMKMSSDSTIAELSASLAQLTSTEKKLRSEIEETNRVKDQFILTAEKMKLENEVLEKKCSDLAEKLSSAENEIETKRSKVAEFEEEIKNLRDEIEKNEQVLKKEKVKNKVNSNRDEEMISKQEVLVNRLEELDEQCESLKQEVSELEIERDEAKEELVSAKSDLKPLQKRVSEQSLLIKNLESENALITEQIKSYEDEVKTLNVEIDSLKEKQDLLILFPDLTEVDSKPTSKAPQGLDPSDPRCIKFEMEQQIYSNTLRISKLDDLNASLKSSLSRIEAMIPKSEQSASSGCVKSDSAGGERTVIESEVPKTEFKERVPLINELQMNYYRSESKGALPNQSSGNLGDKKAFSGRQSESSSDDHGTLSYVERVKNAQMQSEKDRSGASSRRDHCSPLSRPKSGRGDRWASSSSLKPSCSFTCSKCSRSFKTNHELQMHSNFCY